MDSNSQREEVKLGALIEATTGALAIGAVVAYVSGWVYHSRYFSHFGAGWLVELIPFDTLLLRSWQPMLLVAVIVLARRLGIGSVMARPLSFRKLLFIFLFLFLFRHAPKPAEIEVLNLILLSIAAVVLGLGIAEALSWFTLSPPVALFRADPKRVLLFTFMVLILWPSLLGEITATLASHKRTSALPEVVLADGSYNYHALYFDEHRVYCVSLRDWTMVEVPFRRAFGFPVMEKATVTVIAWEAVKALRSPRPAT